jgi:hypothetical protein
MLVFSIKDDSINLQNHLQLTLYRLQPPEKTHATAKDLASPGSTARSGCLTSTTRSFDQALDTKSLSSEGVATAALVAMVCVVEVEVDR